MLLTGVLTLAAGTTAIWAATWVYYDEPDGLIIDEWKLDISQSRAVPEGWRRALMEAKPLAFEPEFYTNVRRSFVLKGAETDGKRIRKYASSLYSVLEFPAAISTGDEISMEREICGLPERRLEFFLFAPYQPRSVKKAFTLEVRVDGETQEHVNVPYDDGRRDTIRLVRPNMVLGADSGCVHLALVLRSNVTKSGASWQRASHVEIWFPRLVRATSSEARGSEDLK